MAAGADWPWLEAQTNISLVADQKEYTLPADFNRHAALVDDDNDTTVPFVSPSVYFHQYGNDTDNTSTQPQFWTIWEDQILITPIPEAADTNRLTLYYYKNPTTLLATTDSPEFDAAFHMLLPEYVKWKLYEREELIQAADRAFGLYSNYVINMDRFYKDRVTWPPFVYGDGRFFKLGDPNIPFLDRI